MGARLQSPPVHATLWRNVIVMSCTIFCTLTGIFCWFRVLPVHLREALGADESQVSYVFFAMAFANRLPQLYGGRLADRIGRKGIIVVVTVLMGLCYAWIGHASSWRMAGLAIVCCWVVGGLQWPSILALITESVPEHARGRALGWFEMAAMAGMTAGPFVGELIERAIPDPDSAWRTLLLLCAGLYLVSALARGLFLHETHVAKAAAPHAPIEWRAIALPAAIGILATAVYFLTTDGPIASLYLKDEIGRSRPEIDRLFFYGGLVALASAPIAGWACDRFGPTRLLRLSFAATAGILAPFALPLAGRPVSAELAPWLFAALFAPAELFVIAFQRLITSQTSAEGRGANVGVYGVLIGIFTPWTYLAAGWLYKSTGHWAPIAAAAALAAVTALLALRLERPTAERPSTPPPPTTSP